MPERYLGQSLGKYRIDAIVGTGGFAWVYRAYDPELDIPVALKILKPQYAGDEKFEERFRREASTAAKLRHPNIIKIYAVGREGDAVYFAMDYLPQGLAERLNVMSTLPESMLLRTGIDVASALSFAHREGVIHRDIKTDNILYDDHGNAIVADFGIARAVSGYAEQTGTNMVVGTPQYFSPEQARGLSLDGRADIYSLGVTLFKAATGVLPFTGDDWYEIARQHVEDEPPSPRSLNPALSPEVEESILVCLAKNPDERFPSGDAVCEHFVHILHERGETAALRTMIGPAASTLSSPRAALRRRRLKKIAPRWWIGGAAALLVLAALVSIVGRENAVASADTVFAGGATGLDGGRAGRNARDSVAMAPPPAVLSVRTPPNAAVTVNGAAVDAGSWSSDSLPPGEYTVVASVDAIGGCPSARRRAVRTLGDTGSVRVDMNPRGCGRLEVTSVTRDARYRLMPLSSDVDQREGALPLREPLVLPEGVYRLRVTAPYCAEYTFNQLRVRSSEATQRIRVPLICDRT
ncbi:MAG: protein kinase domain-containing protein [Gemmatimonadaceae bacterium]